MIVQKVEKDESFYDFQSTEFQLLLLHLQDLYRPQNLAVVTLGLEP